MNSQIIHSAVCNMSLLITAVVLLAILGTTSGCPHPHAHNRCFWKHYPCKDGFSYGCKNRYCWSQCSAILGGHGEWCYTKSIQTGNYFLCDKNEDCADGADCALGKCAGGCTVASTLTHFMRMFESQNEADIQ